MRNLKLQLRGLALVALFVLSLSSAFAGGHLRINPYLNTDYSIVSILNPSETDARLKIYDEAGNIYYSQVVEAESNSQKLFDLSHLEDGEYSLVLVSENSRVEETFLVESKKLFIAGDNVQIAENRTQNSKSYAFKK